MRWLIHLWGECMTFAKLTKAMEVTSTFWMRLLPVMRDIIYHYQDIIADGKLTAKDIEDGKENVRLLNKALSQGGK